jgi:predicted nuclease of restriction endonuclease-like (RecB) superfamily
MVGKKLPQTLAGYETLLTGLKDRIQQAQVRAGLAVNQELISLYWAIGRDILTQETQEGWGAKVVDKLAKDLKASFPEMKGFSARNLRYLKLFAETYPDPAILQAAPAKITWYHNCTLLDKVKDSKEREWYMLQTIENGWSRDVLVHQIESKLYARQGRAITNFKSTLPEARSELAQQILKDPYNFDFLSLGAKALERDLERGLLLKLRDFLLEMGAGFSFVGSQYHLEVGGEDFYLDLLFYHLKLRCFVIVDLKITDFKPEYAGKMGFYLAAVDEQLRHPDDGSAIGLILCKTKNKLIAEYTLRNSQNPIGVSEYRLAEPLPDELSDNLPTIEMLQDKLTTAPFFYDKSYYGVSYYDVPGIKSSLETAPGEEEEQS